MLGLVSTIEWIYWIFSMCIAQPATFKRYMLEYTCVQRTFSIDKARSKLGYLPTNDRDEQIKKGIEWHQASLRGDRK